MKHHAPSNGRVFIAGVGYDYHSVPDETPTNTIDDAEITAPQGTGSMVGASTAS
ncbi:hypothetical protein Terro_1640 [Terriglobus roseus DSM 18391]|uniref:Uncharacterized protein n=1 Tax=Terriglobus roseus (strain DSM 18391 / NRRL B-41598 / KBS 63) TaxID=926566 RepID=I3ZFC6_TERRK|nr:hypothetical protein Terro_1640 [Terriglobus roseus DSM 18391]